MRVERRPINRLDQWTVDDTTIRHESVGDFSVIAVDVETGAREVRRGSSRCSRTRVRSQRVYSATHQRPAALPGARVCLPGQSRSFELGSTVSRSNADHYFGQGGIRLPPDVLFRDPPAEWIRYAAIQSEEAGRCYQYQNRYVILELPEAVVEPSESHRWMTLGADSRNCCRTAISTSKDAISWHASICATARSDRSRSRRAFHRAASRAAGVGPARCLGSTSRQQRGRRCSRSPSRAACSRAMRRRCNRARPNWLTCRRGITEHAESGPAVPSNRAGTWSSTSRPRSLPKATCVASWSSVAGRGVSSRRPPCTPGIRRSPRRGSGRGPRSAYAAYRDVIFPPLPAGNFRYEKRAGVERSGISGPYAMMPAAVLGDPPEAIAAHACWREGDEVRPPSVS